MSDQLKIEGYVDEDGIKWMKSRCFFCHVHCGMLIGTKDGKIVRMKPDENDPLQGMCERIGPNGERAIKNHYHPKRINYALKRAGERGENKWEKIPYEQALDEIAEKLTRLKEKYGPETLAVTEGTYRSDHLWARSRFTNLWGNPGNLADPGSICWCWLYAINLAMVGFLSETAINATIDQSKTIVLWGVRINERHSPQSWLSKQLRAACTNEEQKPNVIVVDPYMIDAVRDAQAYLPIRPGTDTAMMLAWLNVIFTEKLYDEDFVTNWSNGPFLVRTDTRKLLRESDLIIGGERKNFVAWDTREKQPAVWVSSQNTYKSDAIENALEGEYDITLADGKKVSCKTAFSLLKERLAEYSPEKISQITGVPAHKIEKAARTYATQKPSNMSWGVGCIDQAGWNASYGAVCKVILRSVTGNLDIPGGDYLPEPGPVINGQFPVRDGELELSETVAPETREKLLGNDRFRMMGWKGFELCDEPFREMWGIARPQLHQLLSTAPLLWRAILNNDPYPVRAVISWSSNPMVWAPNTKMVYKALKALDLLVVLEYWMTPTAALADYVLPAADWMERPMFTNVEDSLDMFMGGPRASEPVADRRMDYDFFRGLGLRLGQEKQWPWETYEDVIAHRLDRVGITYEEFCQTGLLFPDMDSAEQFEKHKSIRKDGQVRGFATPSRRCEIYPSVFEELDYDPLPAYREPAESPLSSPELAKEFPIILTTGGRFAPMFHSEHRVPGTGTREMHPWPIFEIHLETARDLGIRDGDWCWIETPRGRIRQIARLGVALRPGTIIAQPSWWYPELPAEEPWLCGAFVSNANVLTDDNPDTLDPICGNWTNRGLLCRVYRCEEPEWLTDRVSTDLFLEGKSGYPKAFSV
ncbi:MAG: molybdopterin-dependent oxidoreductase [Pseudomonadota bacterium]